MNSGPTSERVYDQIKRKLLEGRFRPGERLDPAELAPETGSSITPVRDALNRLTGENLVVTGTSEGFHVPHLDEPSLKDLYAWNLEILAVAIKSWDRRKAVPAPEPRDSYAVSDDRFAGLAVAIAARSTNAEHRRAIRSLNERLAAVRRLESSVIPVAAGEIEDMAAAMVADDAMSLQRLLRQYHRIRIRNTALLLRTLYRG